MRRSQLNQLTPFLLLAVAVFVAYHEIFFFDFLYDDEFLIQKNSFLDSFSSIGAIFSGSSTAGAGYADSFYRPLQGLLYLIIQQLFGREPWAFHALNIGVHIGNAWLIFLLGTRMRLSSWAACGAALLWAVHPLHTEAVTYMSATADSLHTFLILSGLVVLAPDFSWKKVPLSCLFFVLALLAKESAIVFPALLVTILFFFAQNPWSLRSYLKSLPAWVIALLYLILRKTLLNFAGDFEMYKTPNIYTENILYRIQTYLATIPSYLELLLWPRNLHMDRQFPVYTEWLHPAVLAGFVVVIAALIFFVLHYRSRKNKWTWPAWIFFWFFASQATQSGILIPVNSLFLEHWMYLPSISLFLGIGALIDRIRIKASTMQRVFLVSAVSVVVIALATATLLQNRYWQSPITLYSRILSFNPAADRIRHNLAMAYSDLNDDDHALQEYEIVLSHTDLYHQTFHNVARIYLKKGRLDEAEKMELKALSKSPSFFPSYVTLAEIATLRGDHQKALEYKKKFDELTHH